MTFTSTDLKAIIAEARPIIERQLDDAEIVASFRTKVTEAGGDWGQVKALLKAMIQDERDEAGGNKRVAALLGKAEHATAYADMLGLGNLNEKNSFPTPPASQKTTAADPAEGVFASSADTNSRPLVGAGEVRAPHQSDDLVGSPLAGAGRDEDRHINSLADSPTAEKGDKPESDTLGKVAGQIATHHGGSGAIPETAAAPVAEGVSPNASSVTPFLRTYAGPRDSKGLPRPIGCQNLDRCGSSTWRKACHLCERAMHVEAGGQAIKHQGQVA